MVEVKDEGYLAVNRMVFKFTTSAPVISAGEIAVAGKVSQFNRHIPVREWEEDGETIHICG